MDQALGQGGDRRCAAAFGAATCDTTAEAVKTTRAAAVAEAEAEAAAASVSILFN